MAGTAESFMRQDMIALETYPGLEKKVASKLQLNMKTSIPFVIALISAIVRYALN